MKDSWALKMAECVLEFSPKLKAGWSYENGLILKALYNIYKHCGDRKYIDFCKNYINGFINTDFTVKGVDLQNHNLNNYNNAKVLIYLYKETNDEKYKKAAYILYENLKQHPRTSEGAFWYNKNCQNQVWLEGIYTAEPFYADCIKLFENRNCFDDVLKQFLLCHKFLKDKETGLLYHCWDKNKNAVWADSNTGRSRCFWGMGVGWYAMALIDCLDILTERVYDRKYLKDIVKNLADVIINFQDEKSGCWYQILDCHERKGNYIEATASCMLLYFLSATYRMDIIKGERVSKAIFNAYNGIIDEFVLITEDCKINLNKNCAGAVLGDKEYKNGSFTHYISEPIVSNDLKGVGAFILAMNEYDKIKYRLDKK